MTDRRTPRRAVVFRAVLLVLAGAAVIALRITGVAERNVNSATGSPAEALLDCGERIRIEGVDR